MCMAMLAARVCVQTRARFCFVVLLSIMSATTIHQALLLSLTYIWYETYVTPNDLKDPLIHASHVCPEL